MNFLIDWLLCAVAFSVVTIPATPIAVARVAVAGVLIAVAIALIPGTLH